MTPGRAHQCRSEHRSRHEVECRVPFGFRTVASGAGYKFPIRGPFAPERSPVFDFTGRQNKVAFAVQISATATGDILNAKIRLLGIFSLAVIIGCAADSPTLPSVTEAPTGKRLQGKVVWHDLITDTPAESRRFYERLFGWEFESVGAALGFASNDAYTLIRNNGRLIGGMVDANQIKNEDDISQWVALISVADVERATSMVESGGGTVFTPPTDLAARGTIAVVADNTGALFALLQTKSGDPADREPDYGDFLWDELWTNDVEKATAFYQEIAGYEAVDENVDDDDREEDYRLFMAGGKPRAGVMDNPFGDVRPVWVNYLRVEDPAAITARVEALGGRILVEAQPRDIGGEVAFIAGPSGAGIALQTWPIRDNQGKK